MWTFSNDEKTIHLTFRRSGGRVIDALMYSAHHNIPIVCEKKEEVESLIQIATLNKINIPPPTCLEQPNDFQEGWVKFTRYPCKEGHLDLWRGDCNSNPNDPEKNPMNLNLSASYWRCNDGPWVHDQELGRSVAVRSLLELREGFTATEIWEELIKPR